MKFVLRWLQANSIILLNSSSLVGATLITSGLGFVYWWLAARWFPPEAIGIASAAVSAVMLLGNGSALGFGTLLITELPRQPEKSGALMNTALLVVGIVGSIVGSIFAVITSHTTPGFRPLGASLIDIMTFSSGVGLSAMTLVLDQALIGLLRGGLQFWRNAFFAFLKLAALLVVSFWPSNQEGMKIYATWMLSSGISLGLVALSILLKKNGKRKSYWPQWRLLRRLGLAAVQHHMLNLTLQAPTQLLPVIVTVLLSARINAWFYVAWMIASFIFIVPGALTTVLHATNAAQQTTLARKARLTIGVSLAIAIAANFILQIGATQVLALFGGTYASQASWCLRILLLAAFPLTIKNHYISLCRIQDRIMKAMIAMLPGGLVELGAAVVGARLAGLPGLSLGWVSAIFLEAAFMLPTVYKIISAVEITAIPAQIASQKQEPRSLEVLPLSSSETVEAIWLVETLVTPAIHLVHTKTHMWSNCRQQVWLPKQEEASTPQTASVTALYFI